MQFLLLLTSGLIALRFRKHSLSPILLLQLSGVGSANRLLLVSMWKMKILRSTSFLISLPPLLPMVKETTALFVHYAREPLFPRELRLN